MVSDIILEEEKVVVEGNLELEQIIAKNNQLKVKCWDFILDWPDNRKGLAQFRRALVHQNGDKLVINYGGDYSAGIKLDGKGVEIPGPLNVGEITAINNQLVVHGWDLVLDAKERRAAGSDPKGMRRAFVHDTGDKLTLNWGKDFPGGVKIDGRVEIPDMLSLGSSLRLSKGLNVKNASVKEIEFCEDPLGSTYAPLSSNKQVHQTITISPGMISYRKWETIVLAQKPAHDITMSSQKVTTTELESFDLIEVARNLKNEVNRLKERLKKAGIPE